MPPHAPRASHLRPRLRNSGVVGSEALDLVPAAEVRRLVLRVLDRLLVDVVPVGTMRAASAAAAARVMLASTANS